MQQVNVQEGRRLKALYSYKILHTKDEKEYDELTKLASSICDSPVSLINLIDDSEQWSKSVYGISLEERSIPRSKTICQYAIQKIDLFEVPDLSADDRFKDASYVKNDPKFRYYLGAPLENSDGQIIGTLCILDYKPKKLSAEKKSQLRILANQVMAHLELRKHNAELKRLNQYHVQLMKMLSHDLRAPLNGIIGLSDLMIQSDSAISDEESKNLIEGISRSAKQLKQMISEIFNYALLDTMGFELDVHSADLGETLNKMKALYEPLARFKNIDLRFELDNNLGKVQIDVEKFEQIYGNLLSNAIKYTESGGSVRSMIKVVPDNGSHSLILNVKDTGIGISEELRRMLLQGKAGQKQGAKSDVDSTGIGITIIKRFVDMFNGKLEISSEAGKGSEFTVTLPVQSAE